MNQGTRVLAGVLGIFAMMDGLAPRAAVAEPVRKVVSVGPEGSPWGDATIAIARRIAAETNGRIKPRALPGGVAGEELDTVRACAEGKVWVWGGSGGALARVVPELAAIELPFLFDDIGEVTAALSGRTLALLVRAAARAGLTLPAGLSEVGFRSFAGPKPYRSPADLAGVRVRSQESPTHLEMWRLLGAEPKAISVLETLPALDSGVVQAFDHSPVYMFATSWYQKARVYTMSRHIYQPGVAVLCMGATAGLSAADRKIVVEIVRQEVERSRVRVRELDAQVMDQLRKEGMQIVELTPAERAVFKERTRPLVEAFRRTTTPLGREILDAILKSVEARRR